ncbi:predicted protein [Streptomyces viridosporus ATCC 14672]|uniref:Predicted protein n=1 Tax=Streptomyces viridosporus (strain ATCC 14672 / DSM 40746 / JCM 4963 / KCTC 9882 / NRRL B-12104 / FH 1290) TaxID=566461 RepID=D5ZNW0_STRV1|nr:predicted protein [Streptomyces viridosporus ATCC 14672]
MTCPRTPALRHGLQSASVTRWHHQPHSLADLQPNFPSGCPQVSPLHQQGREGRVSRLLSHTLARLREDLLTT